MTTQRRTMSRTRNAPPTRSTRIPARTRRNPLPFILAGAGGGGVLLVGVVALALGSRPKVDKKKTVAETASMAAKKPVTSPQLHESGLQKCDEGLKLLLAAQTRIEARKHSGEEELRRLRLDLEEADRLLGEGLHEIDESKILGEVTRYTNAKSTVRKLLMELKS